MLGLGRAPAATPWRPGSRERPPPARPSCRLRQAQPLARRTASLDGGGPVVDAASLETIQLREFQPSIPRARGDHHRAGADTLVIDQPQDVVAVCAMEIDRLIGY